MVAAGKLAVITRFTGKIFNTEGAVPKEQVICPLVQAKFGIEFFLIVIRSKLLTTIILSKRTYTCA